MINLFVRSAIISIAAFSLAGCKTTEGPRKLGNGVSVISPDKSWSPDADSDFSVFDDEPEQPSWAKQASHSSASHSRSRIDSIRQMARRLAPAGANISSLSGMIGKRRQASIGCIPEDLRMILNTVAWHYGKRVHIQSGYRSKHHNRRIGGAKGSYHVSCKAVDIQVSGINKYKLAKFLKTLPGRGGVGTYCNISTVHIDVGPKRAWHSGCRKRSRRRHYARKRK